MTRAQMIEGTTEEITRQMQQSYADQKLRVFIEPEENEDLAAGIPDPPDTIRDKAHLMELLHEGMNSPTVPFTDDSSEKMHQEVKASRTPGLHAGQYQISDDFDAPLPDSFWLGGEGNVKTVSIR
jgi:hypothetical protein